MKDTPLTNPDLVLYVDGSASRDQSIGMNRVGYSVVTDSDTVSLPSHYSAQAAELVALTEACKCAKNKSVTIYRQSLHLWGGT